MMNKQIRTLADVKTHVYEEQAAKKIIVLVSKESKSINSLVHVHRGVSLYDPN